MNYFTRLGAILALVISAQAFSATFSVPSYFQILYVDREKISLFGDDQQVELEPGLHEVLIRYDQTIERFNEDHTFRSEPIIIDLNIREADQLKLTAIEPKKVSEAKKFLKILEFEIVDQHDDVADYESHVLPLKPGIQWGRNYLKEIIEYKEMLHTKSKLAILEAQVGDSDHAVETSKAASSEFNVLKVWYNKADKDSKIAFRFWIIDPSYVTQDETETLKMLKKLYTKTTPLIQRELQIWMIK